MSFFIVGDWNAKVGSQEIPGVTGKFGLGVQNEAGRRLIVLSRECTSHKKHPFPKTQKVTMHGHHKMVNTRIRLIIFFAAKDGETLYSQQEQDRELTSSDHELPIAKFRLKLKKVGKTTRPFRSDLNLIPYNFTLEMTNRFKGIDVVDRVLEELWTEVHNIVQEAVTLGEVHFFQNLLYWTCLIAQSSMPDSLYYKIKI